ncbi:antA/AntB antirepressor family protein, partial [Gilliamella sp. Imp1-1]
MTDFNNLVPVTETQLNGKLQQTVSAKQLHHFLGVGRDFSTWIKGRIEQYGFIENDDYVVFDSPELVNQSIKNKQLNKRETVRGGDRRSIDYHLTLNMAKELAM